MRSISILLLSVFTSIAFALSPAPPWYPHTPSPQDIEQLNAVACLSHGTHLEEVSLGSRTQDPELQPRDLNGSVTCSPHAVADAVIWRHVAFCDWRADHWACEDKRTVAEFSVGSKTHRVDYYTESFSRARIRKLFGDVFGLGKAASQSKKTIASGACVLERKRESAQNPIDGSWGELELISLICADKIYGLDEKCKGDKCSYATSYSFSRN